MTTQTIIEWMELLAKSQGFYQRRLQEFRQLSPETQKEILQDMREAGVRDITGFILYMEGI